MSTEKTIFKRIIDGEIPADIIYEDDLCLAFNDISAQAPVHVLIIPRKEIPSVNEIADEDKPLIGHMWCIIRDLADKLGVANDGYRVLVNCGEYGGQTVHHLHYHLLGGRPLTGPLA